MSRVPLLLSTGFGGTTLVAAEALWSLQSLSGGTEIPMGWVVQIGALITSVGAFVYAGRVIGKWETAQTKLISKVETIDPMSERIATLEGMVSMLETRTRSHDAFEQQKQKAKVSPKTE